MAAVFAYSITRLDTGAVVADTIGDLEAFVTERAVAHAAEFRLLDKALSTEAVVAAAIEAAFAEATEVLRAASVRL